MTIIRERKSHIAGRETGGAVTHVLANNQMRGIAIFIQTNLESAE